MLNSLAQAVKEAIDAARQALAAANRAALSATQAAASAAAAGAGGTAMDVGALRKAANLSDVASPGAALANLGAVPSSRNVNGKPLSADVTLSAGDVGAVPTTRRVNGQALSADLTLTAAQNIIIACGDETTGINATGVKVTFRAPYAMALTGIRMSLTTAQATGALLTVDVKKNGVSLFTTLLTINNTSRTSVGATTPAVLVGGAALASDDEITVSVTQVGDGTAAGLKVTLTGAA